MIEQQEKNLITEFLTPERLNAFKVTMQEACRAIIKDDMAKAEHYIEQNLEIELEKEKSFVIGIINAYELWSSEKKVIVLWDVDDTMGRFNFDINSWGFRVSLKELLRYLKQKFPAITNGIITNRVTVKEQLADNTALGSIAEFFDKNYAFSSRGFAQNMLMRGDMHKEVQELTELVDQLKDRNQEFNPNIYDKFVMLMLLKKQNLNVKIIDDSEVAKLGGVDGLYTKQVIPDQAFLKLTTF